MSVTILVHSIDTPTLSEPCVACGYRAGEALGNLGIEIQGDGWHVTLCEACLKKAVQLLLNLLEK